MSNKQSYSLDEAQRELAKICNGEVWRLMEKSNRSTDEDELMVLAAAASLYHWMQVGKPVHCQRGEWLLSRVYVVLEEPASALKHALRCLALCEANVEEMQDFDVAYTYEGIARAHTLAGNTDQAQKYLPLAIQVGEAIANEEDKALFMGDFKGGKWYGVSTR